MGASSRCRLFMRTFSFEGSNTQRTVTSPRGGGRAIGRRRVYRRRRRHRLVVTRGFQKCCGGSKKHVSGHGAAEIEQAVIVAGRPAHEHVFEHLFDGTGRTAVADEICPKFTVPGSAECMLSRRILISFPSSTMVVRALCAEVGLMESSNSISDSLVRPMIPSCASVDSAFHALRSWRYFCTIT